MKLLVEDKEVLKENVQTLNGSISQIRGENVRDKNIQKSTIELHMDLNALTTDVSDFKKYVYQKLGEISENVGNSRHDDDNLQRKQVKHWQQQQQQKQQQQQQQQELQLQQQQQQQQQLQQQQQQQQRHNSIQLQPHPGGDTTIVHNVASMVGGSNKNTVHEVANTIVENVSVSNTNTIHNVASMINSGSNMNTVNQKVNTMVDSGLHVNTVANTLVNGSNTRTNMVHKAASNRRKKGGTVVSNTRRPMLNNKELIVIIYC